MKDFVAAGDCNNQVVVESSWPKNGHKFERQNDLMYIHICWRVPSGLCLEVIVLVTSLRYQRTKFLQLAKGSKIYKGKNAMVLYILDTFIEGKIWTRVPSTQK
jgi:hypothetical protein